jgi:hypothetical protein
MIIESMNTTQWKDILKGAPTMAHPMIFLVVNFHHFVKSLKA